MVFFDALRNIEKRLGEAYFYALLPAPPNETIEDYQRTIRHCLRSLDAVKEAQDDLELLLALVTEEPREIELLGQYALKKSDLYGTLGIRLPMRGSPIGVVALQPVAVKKEEDEEKESEG